MHKAMILHKSLLGLIYTGSSLTRVVQTWLGLWVERWGFRVIGQVDLKSSRLKSCRPRTWVMSPEIKSSVIGWNRVRDVAGSLCCVLGRDTWLLQCFSSPQENELSGKADEYLGDTLQWSNIPPSGTINNDKLQTDVPLSFSADFTFVPFLFSHFHSLISLSVLCFIVHWEAWCSGIIHVSGRV